MSLSGYVTGEGSSCKHGMQGLGGGGLLDGVTVVGACDVSFVGKGGISSE